MELSKSLQLPIKDKENLIRFFIGGLLNILPVVNLLSTGYAFLMMRDHILHEPVEDLPAWDNWGAFFKYGFLSFLASLGYALIPIFIFGLGMAALYPHVGILTFLGVTLIVIGIICFIAAMLLFPMGMILFAIEDEFSSFFSFFKIVDLVLKNLGDYLKAFVILFVMGLILGLFSYIPFVGWIIGVFVGFYLLLETAFLMGDIGRKIVAAEAEPPQQSSSVTPYTSGTTPTSTSGPGSSETPKTETENDEKTLQKNPKNDEEEKKA